MVLRPSVLCPVDFSNASRIALRYATAVAEHFSARLVLVTVNDPLMTEAAALTLGPGWLPEDADHELRRFFDETFEHRSTGPIELVCEVGTGKPAPEILRVAREQKCDLIVMSTRGVTGMRKLFFGSTTERVLRETTLPVLCTPPVDVGPLDLEVIRARVRRLLVPVDFSAATARQLQLARGLAEAIDIPVVLAHVIEPVRFPLPPAAHLPNVDTERRARAEKLLDDLVQTIPPRLKPEALVVYGDPAEEIAKVTSARQAGLIVMGLHSSPLAGPRMGSVTYRVLCLAPTLVLALPPAPDPKSHRIGAVPEEMIEAASTP
jgi:nucleotide-binding universal stress UspA family protein